MTGETCTRCGDSVIHSTPDRFQLQAWDFSTSTAAYFEGRLCTVCWNDLIRFMAADPADRRWATA
jgi:hypothetical protein